MATVDLHIHSAYSDDGQLSPGKIMALAQGRHMRILAITDHNSVRAVDEAVALAGACRVLSGVELDCAYRGKGFHLLGYGFDHTRREFGAIEADIFEQERAAAGEKIRLFRSATGIPVSEVALLAAAHGGVVTGELIAEHLLAHEQAARYELLHPYLPGGEKSDMPNTRFYWDFFAEGKPAYVPIRYLSLPDAVALIHDAGGLAVLAHPRQNLGGDDALLEDIISQGIDGIEAFSSYHSAPEAAHYADLARRHGILVTCGSDFHGKHKPNISLGGHGGDHLEAELAEKLLQRL